MPRPSGSLEVRRIILPKRGLALNTFNLHGFNQGGHARFDRQTIGDDQALGTLTIGAKHALGAVIFGMVPENMDAVGKQGRGYHFAFISGQFFPIPGKRDFFRFGNCQNRMFGNAFQSHVCCFHLIIDNGLHVRLLAVLDLFNWFDWFNLFNWFGLSRLIQPMKLIKQN